MNVYTSIDIGIDINIGIKLISLPYGLNAGN